jgi:hypothetical protein
VDASAAEIFGAQVLLDGLDTKLRLIGRLILISLAPRLRGEKYLFDCTLV